jgi:hypothetical protein
MGDHIHPILLVLLAALLTECLAGLSTFHNARQRRQLAGELTARTYPQQPDRNESSFRFLSNDTKRLARSTGAERMLLMSHSVPCRIVA